MELFTLSKTQTTRKDLHIPWHVHKLFLGQPVIMLGQENLAMMRLTIREALTCNRCQTVKLN